jgi:hypothetical protein
MNTKFENAIFVENLHLSLSSEEQNKIISLLDQQQVEIVFRENKDTVKACLFDAVTIFFNEPLTKAIITGLLTSGAYDAIKFTISCFLNNLKNYTLVKYNSKEGVEKKTAQLNLRLKTGNAEMNVLLPNNYTQKQNLEYLDRMLKTMVEIGKTDIPHIQKYEMYVIEGNDDDRPELLKVKTIVQYAREQQKKQKNKSNT